MFGTQISFSDTDSREDHDIISDILSFKAELPRFFIERLTREGDCVYDPFMGRGTTLLEAALMGRAVAGNDVNPLSRLLVQPRLKPPSLSAVAQRLSQIPREAPVPDEDRVLLAFYHPRTLVAIIALKDWLREREASGRFDHVDDWIRLVAINRLTGHSSGFFSVYSLPPNQAVSIESQIKINEKRGQTPPERDIAAIIMKKSRNLLGDGGPKNVRIEALMTRPSWDTPELAAGSVDLVVTSPPFLDIVNYKVDNWLRCWFAGIDPDGVAIAHHRTPEAWEGFVRKTFGELARLVRPGGHVAFEVGEVRKGKVLLEQHVLRAVEGLPFVLLGVMVNDQQFTKTANCWGVSNNEGGTNTNRIVLLRRR